MEIERENLRRRTVSLKAHPRVWEKFLATKSPLLNDNLVIRQAPSSFNPKDIFKTLCLDFLLT